MNAKPADVSYLPVPNARPPAWAIPPATPAPARPLRTHFHMVVVGPRDPERLALAGALWDQGMLVTAFESLQEAEGVLVGENVHGILLDARLGEQPAALLCGWLRAAGKADVRVIVVGTVSPAARAALMAAGVAYVVPAPQDVDLFAGQLSEAVGLCRTGWRG